MRKWRPKKAGFLFVMSLLFLTFKSQAASFDCSKATTKIEKMVCADEVLSKIDEELAKAYEIALPKAPDAAVVKQQQKDWLKERNRC